MNLPATNNQPPQGYQPPQGSKTLAGVIGSTAAAVALFIMIPAEESGRKVEATLQGDGSIKVKHIAGKQYLSAYRDVIGIATACDGITRNIKMGHTFTESQCNAMLEAEVIAHAEPIIRCVPALYGRQQQLIAGVSLSFNIGTAGFCKSSIARLWNAGQWRAGCDRFLLYDKAGGRVIKGLSARRAREHAICRKGLS